ncbi:helix-turn-helix transcriptional regulator [Thalassobacillus sp. CUG 92003]|uniref:helix-turn-helix domain-containing protein n=1 Tax=Thalassobacillus sp. CUG 92003 TaxID=2736641 RepID=UPI0015E78D29
MLKDRLIKLRNDKGISQYEIAKRLNFSRGKYANYEHGTRQPDYETLNKIADFYGVSTDYLLGRAGNSDNPEDEKGEFDSIKEINRLLDKYEIEEMSFFDYEKWKSMSPEQIRELESYFQYLVQKSNDIEKKDK